VLFEAYSKDSVHQLSVSIEIIKTFQTMEEVEKKTLLRTCRFAEHKLNIF
jgi:hypothetical protein